MDANYRSSVDNNHSTVSRSINRREQIRIYYPLDYDQRFLPILTIKGKFYRILDVSENGIRFVYKYLTIPRDGIISGIIAFPDGESFEIIGTIIRRSTFQIALRLDRGIPYQRIYKEQVRMRKLESNPTTAFKL